jgi:hypothetical protein
MSLSQSKLCVNKFNSNVMHAIGWLPKVAHCDVAAHIVGDAPQKAIQLNSNAAPAD